MPFQFDTNDSIEALSLEMEATAIDEPIPMLRLLCLLLNPAAGIGLKYDALMSVLPSSGCDPRP